jgi:hypothetical protein
MEDIKVAACQAGLVDDNVIEPESIPSRAAVGSVTIQMRSYQSVQHLWAAEHFVRLAAECEAAHVGEPRFSIRHRSYALGAVGEAVAFLEAFINELFQDAKDATDGVVGATAAQGLLPPIWCGLWRPTGIAPETGKVFEPSQSTMRHAYLWGPPVRTAADCRIKILSELSSCAIGRCTIAL